MLSANDLLARRDMAKLREKQHRGRTFADRSEIDELRTNLAKARRSEANLERELARMYWLAIGETGQAIVSAAVARRRSGAPPLTARELAKAALLTRGGVHHHLKSLAGGGELPSPLLSSPRPRSGDGWAPTPWGELVYELCHKEMKQIGS